MFLKDFLHIPHDKVIIKNEHLWYHHTPDQDTLITFHDKRKYVNEDIFVNHIHLSRQLNIQIENTFTLRLDNHCIYVEKHETFWLEWAILIYKNNELKGAITYTDHIDESRKMPIHNYYHDNGIEIVNSPNELYIKMNQTDLPHQQQKRIQQAVE